MTDHPPFQELEQYWRRTLSPAAFRAVHRHVATCPSCAEQSSPQQLARDFEELREALLPAMDAAPYHLSAPEVAAYGRGELSEIDHEIVESHLVTCAACSDEVQHSRVAAAGHPEANGRGVHTVWQLPFRWLDGSRPWRVAAVVCSGSILILLALFLFRTKIAERSEQTVQPETANSPQDSGSANNRADAQRAQENPPNNGDESHSAPPADKGALSAAQFVVTLNDGGERITLNNRGELAGLEELPAHVRQAVRAALQAGRVERPPIIAQLAGRPSTLLSQSDNGLPSFQLISPVGQVVESERPSFSWSTLAGARNYTVSVTDADLNEVAASPPLAATEWRMTKSLRPGAIYSWQVTALKDGKAITSPVLPAPQAKFKVVDRETLEMLRRGKGSYHGSHLAAGVLYAEAGLLTKAEQELRALVHVNPHDRIAREILRSVQAMNQGPAARSGRNHRSSPIKINAAQ